MRSITKGHTCVGYKDINGTKLPFNPVNSSDNFLLPGDIEPNGEPVNSLRHKIGRRFIQISDSNSSTFNVKRPTECTSNSMCTTRNHDNLVFKTHCNILIGTLMER